MVQAHCHYIFLFFGVVPRGFANILFEAPKGAHAHVHARSEACVRMLHSVCREATQNISIFGLFLCLGVDKSPCFDFGVDNN